MGKNILCFRDADEMLGYIKNGNDLYSPMREQYVWLYNTDGSIACASLSEKDMVSKGHEMCKYGDNTLIYESLQGLIYDDPSYDGFGINKISNLEFCENAYNAAWINAGEYITPEDEGSGELSSAETESIKKLFGGKIWKN